MSGPLLTSSIAFVALFACFAAFLAQRAPAVVYTSESLPVVDPVVVIPVYANLTAACLAACGTSSSCNQSQTTGIVWNCVTCHPPAVPVRASCVNDTCAAAPWCSTADAAHVGRVHNALVRAALDFNNASTLYPPLGPITTSANWTAVLAPMFHPATAIDLLNRFLVGKFALLGAGSSANPGPWFDDEAGFWWGAYAAYQPPAAYADYLTRLKRTLCPARWRLDTTTGDCVH